MSDPIYAIPKHPAASDAARVPTLGLSNSAAVTEQELHAGASLVIGGSALVAVAIGAVVIAYSAWCLQPDDATGREFYAAGTRLADALWTEFGKQAGTSLQSIRETIRQIQHTAMTLRGSVGQRTATLRTELDNLLQKLAGHGRRSPAQQPPSGSLAPSNNIVRLERSHNRCVMEFAATQSRSPDGSRAVAASVRVDALIDRPGLLPLPAMDARTSVVFSTTHVRKDGNQSTSYATGNGNGSSTAIQITRGEEHDRLVLEGRGFCTFGNNQTLPAVSPDGNVRRLTIK